MGLYRYADVRTVHLEITNKCNASCPQCSRSDSGGPVNPLLPLTELSFADVQKIFPTDFICQLKMLLVCGNYGDAIVAEDTLQICRFFRQTNPSILIGFHTNGSARTSDWWQELASIVSPGYVRFGIDGLADTNHLYRRGTNWKTLMRNVEAFIEAGGHAEWDFIMFEHNEHQVEEARALSKSMGFEKFLVKRTNRFFDHAGLEGFHSSTPVKNRDGAITGHLHVPSDDDRQNPSFVAAESLKRKYGSLRTFFADSEISCRVAPEGSIYVSATGHVVPCCWLGTHAHRQEFNSSNDVFLRGIEALGGMERLDARLHSIKDIVDGPIFQDVVTDGWRPGAKRNRTCAKICSQEYLSYVTLR
jgi:MoaA/NifB/PqqE/SkfB family radical SAM enzyme